jgi:ATP-dependent helicase/nuclease subunit A
MQGSVRKRGDKWYYSFELASMNGKRKRVERTGGRTKKEALAAMRKAIEEYQQAGKVAGESSMSISDYLDYWYENYVEVSLRYNTQLSYQAAIKHIKDVLGSYHLSRLSPAAVQDFLNQMYKDGYSKGTIIHRRIVLSKALNMAVHPYQYIKDNPAHYAKVPKAAKKTHGEELKIISKEQFHQLLKLFPRGSVHHLPLLIGYHTGLRKSEICGLTWDCIDLETGTLSVKKIQIMHTGEDFSLDAPKTASSVRTISISSHLVKALKNHQLDQKKNALKYGAYYEHSGFVCTHESGRPITSNTLHGTSRTVKRNLGFAFTFHMLRHTHASMLLAAGMSMKAIQLRLGHSDITTTMNVYAHLTEDLEKASAAYLEQL